MSDILNPWWVMEPREMDRVAAAVEEVFSPSIGWLKKYIAQPGENYFASEEVAVELSPAGAEKSYYSHKLRRTPDNMVFGFDEIGQASVHSTGLALSRAVSQLATMSVVRASHLRMCSVSYDFPDLEALFYMHLDYKYAPNAPPLKGITLGLAHLVKYPGCRIREREWGIYHSTDPNMKQLDGEWHWYKHSSGSHLGGQVLSADQWIELIESKGDENRFLPNLNKVIA